MSERFSSKEMRKRTDSICHNSYQEGGIDLPSAVFVRAGLEVSEPGDALEKEADHFASIISNGGTIHKKASAEYSGGGLAVSSRFASRLSKESGRGMGLPSVIRSKLESAFGRDFSDVVVHDDSKAAEMSRSIGAKAFTHGKDIYFNSGRFSPDTQEGQSLIAHELTHVAQGGGAVARQEDNLISGGEELYSRDTDMSTEDDICRMMLLEELTKAEAFDLQVKQEINVKRKNSFDNDGEYDDNDRPVLDKIGGNGWVTTEKNYDIMARRHKSNAVLGTLDNMRGGLFGSSSVYVAMKKGYTDVDFLYNWSSQFASIDSAFLAHEKSSGGLRMPEVFGGIPNNHNYRFFRADAGPVRVGSMGITDIGRHSITMSQPLTGLKYQSRQYSSDVSSASTVRGKARKSLLELKKTYESQIDILSKSSSLSSKELVDLARLYISEIDSKLLLIDGE